MPDSPNLVEQIVVQAAFEGFPQVVNFMCRDARSADALILRAMDSRRAHVLGAPSLLPKDQTVETTLGTRTMPGWMHPYDADVVGDDAVPRRTLRGYVDLRLAISMCASVQRVPADAISAPFRE